jgi:hypothetical protein
VSKEALLFVACCPRSGSQYAAELLARSGLRVGHERMPRAGVGFVSCLFAVDEGKYAAKHGGRLSEYRFDHVWHQVRHPLRSIRSCADTLQDDFWPWQEEFTGVPGRSVEAVAWFWVRWNEIIESLQPAIRYRVEDMPERWDELMFRLDRRGTPLPWVPPGFGAVRHDTPELAWGDLGNAAETVRAMARRYGYEVSA